MRLLLASLMLAGAAWGQTPQFRLFDQPNLPHSSLAFFEAFRGTEAPCTCTTPSGARGEVLSFSRASTQTCTRTVGVEPQAIASGDLVSCASGQPVVMPGADGTGVSGLLVEGASTNLLLRSGDLSNAAWSATNNTGTNVTVTGAYAAAPDGTTTATRLQIPAVVGTSRYNVLEQAVTFVGTSLAWCYFRSTPGAGAQNTYIANIAGAGNPAMLCATTEASWKICSVVSPAGSARIGIGANSYLAAEGANIAASDVLVWGCMAESGATVPTSYIPTVAATASRVATSTPYFDLASAPCAAGTCSMSATAAVRNAASAPWASMLLSSVGAPPYMGFYNGTLSSGTFSETFNSTSVKASTTARGAFASTRVAAWNDGAEQQGMFGATALTPAAGTRAIPGARFYLMGSYNAGYEAAGVIKQICLDPSPSRCR